MMKNTDNFYANMSYKEMNEFGEAAITAIRRIAEMTDENGYVAYKRIVDAEDEHKKLVNEWTVNTFVYASSYLHKNNTIVKMLSQDLKPLGVIEELEDIVLGFIIPKLSVRPSLLHPSRQEFTLGLLTSAINSSFSDFYKKYIRKSKKSKHVSIVSLDEDAYCNNTDEDNPTRRGDLYEDNRYIAENIYFENTYPTDNYSAYLYSKMRGRDFDMLFVAFAISAQDANILKTVDTINSSAILFIKTIDDYLHTINGYGYNLNIPYIIKYCVRDNGNSIIFSDADQNIKKKYVAELTETFRHDIAEMLDYKYSLQKKTKKVKKSA